MTLDTDAVGRLLDEERRRLEAARATVEGDLTSERESALVELSSYDQHPAERGSEVEDLSRDVGLHADFSTLLAENDAARRRLREGTYGRCEACGRPIGPERLRVVPSTRYCVEHQRDADRLAASAGEGST